MKFSLVNVLGESPDGLVYGTWLQNVIGSVDDAFRIAGKATKANSEAIKVAVVDEIPSSTPHLGWHTNLNPYRKIMTYADLEALPGGEYRIMETGEIVDLADLRFGYDGQVLTIKLVVF